MAFAEFQQMFYIAHAVKLALNQTREVGSVEIIEEPVTYSHLWAPRSRMYRRSDCTSSLTQLSH